MGKVDADRMDLTAYAAHSRFTDPGIHTDLVAEVPIDNKSLHTAVMQTILHYRAGEAPPTPRQLIDIDRRWVWSILDAATEHGPRSIIATREPSQRVGGCCRDHSLLAVAILRQHGIPARTRVGFAGYFTPGFRHDHVVAERWNSEAERWQRFDPELNPHSYDFDVWDMPTGPTAPFVTAAEAWLAYRHDRTDASTYGVDPTLPQLAGPRFIGNYVMIELAHRMRVETLLWDMWPANAIMDVLVDGELFTAADRIAELTVRADAGRIGAAAELAKLWRDNTRLQPGRVVRTWSPNGRVGKTDFEAQTTEWE